MCSMFGVFSDNQKTSYPLLILVAGLAILVGLLAWYLSQPSIESGGAHESATYTSAEEPEPRPEPVEYSDDEMQTEFGAALPEDAVDSASNEAWREAFDRPASD